MKTYEYRFVISADLGNMFPELGDTINVIARDMKRVLAADHKVSVRSTVLTAILATDRTLTQEEIERAKRTILVGVHMNRNSWAVACDRIDMLTMDDGLE